MKKETYKQELERYLQAHHVAYLSDSDRKMLIHIFHCNLLDLPKSTNEETIEKLIKLHIEKNKKQKPSTSFTHIGDIFNIDSNQKKVDRQIQLLRLSRHLKK